MIDINDTTEIKMVLTIILIVVFTKSANATNSFSNMVVPLSREF